MEENNPYKQQLCFLFFKCCVIIIVICVFACVCVIGKLTGVLWVHMGRVESEVDEEGDGHSELEPLHHVGLPVERVGHVTSQNHGVPSTGSHKLGLLSDSVGTCSTKYTQRVI